MKMLFAAVFIILITSQPCLNSGLEVPQAAAQISRAAVGPPGGLPGAPAHSNNYRCEPMTIQLCSNIQYNMTIMPNLLGHTTQQEVNKETHRWGPLVRMDCSKYLHRFLCTVYAPVCTIIEEPVPPCRALCLAAQNGCRELMNKFNVEWPQYLDCSRFPRDSRERLCVDGNADDLPDPSSHLDWPNTKPQGTLSPLPTFPGAGMQFECPAHLQVEPAREYKIYIGNETVENCGAPCNKMFFTEEQMEFSRYDFLQYFRVRNMAPYKPKKDDNINKSEALKRYWLGTWSTVCLISCLFTVLSFIIDTSRFAYPERPIIYLSACFAMVAVGFVIGFSMGDEIACDAQQDSPKPNLVKERTIRQGFLDDWRCTILFMIIYFFLMSGSIWWVMLTVCWFLSASLKWGQEAIDSQSQWFHCVAWGVPAIITIVVQVIRKVEGDILSGTCFVGLWDVWSMRWLVLAPLLVYVTIGTIFLLLGLFSLVKIRTVMKQDGGKTDKLEKLIARIGVFSILYTIPKCVIIACLFYEQHYLSAWMVQWQDSICRDPLYIKYWQIPCPPRSQYSGSTPRPDFTVYMIKYLMIMMIGIFSGFWVWTEKTLQTWLNFFRGLCGIPRRQSYV